MSCLTPEFSDAEVIYDIIEYFFNKKKEIDYNDRFNGIVFTKRGPQYLEDFTLNPSNILKAIKLLEPHFTKANIAGGIFVAATFVAEVFKRISGKVFRLIILIDPGSSKIQEDHIFFLEDLLDKVKDLPFIMDAIAINTSDPKEELILMKLCRRTGGDIYEINMDYEKIKEWSFEISHEEIEVQKPQTILEKLSKLSKTTMKFAKKLKGDIIEQEEPEDINPLATVFKEMAKKKDIKHGIIDEDNKIEIPERNLIFFESLADKLLEIEVKERQKCTICFTSVTKNREMLQCPLCQTHVHKICAAIWAKTSHIASNTPYLFRCHNCFNLVKMDEDFSTLVNNSKTPVIELFDMEDIVLEEYLRNLETEEGPKLISTEDQFAISIDEDEVELIMKDEVEIVWCPSCGKMTSNEFLKCPQCGYSLKKETSLVEEVKESKEIEDTEVFQEVESFEDIEAEANQIISEIKEGFNYIKEMFNKLVTQNKVEDAYNIVEDFKNSNKNVLEDLELEEISTFFEEVEKMWEDYSTTNEQYLEQKKLIEEEENRIRRKKEQLEKIQEILSKSSELVENFAFDEALELLDSTHDEINIVELDFYKEKLKEKQDEIRTSKQAYDLLQKEFIKLENSFNENYDHNKFPLALSDSKQLAKIAEELGKINLKKEFMEKSIEIQNTIDEIKANLGKLFKEGLELLNHDDLEGAIKKANEISDFIKDHQY
jgi:uncharacterized C2H2 Zn-finger protein